MSIKQPGALLSTEGGTPLRPVVRFQGERAQYAHEVAGSLRFHAHLIVASEKAVLIHQGDHKKVLQRREQYMQQAPVIKTADFQQAYERLSSRTQKNVDSKIEQLRRNPAYPSLQSHRAQFAKAENMWICYISITKRLLYQYKDGSIYLWDVGEHAIVERIRSRRFN